MVKHELDREPTAHVEAEFGVDIPRSGDVDREPTAHVEADLQFHPPGGT